MYSSNADIDSVNQKEKPSKESRDAERIYCIVTSAMTSFCYTAQVLLLLLLLVGSPRDKLTTTLVFLVSRLLNHSSSSLFPLLFWSGRVKGQQLFITPRGLLQVYRIPRAIQFIHRSSNTFFIGTINSSLCCCLQIFYFIFIYTQLRLQVFLNNVFLYYIPWKKFLVSPDMAS